MTSHHRRARSASVSRLLAWIAATGWEAHQFARRRRSRTQRLTAAEREACIDELAEQYALGRIDEAELDIRVDLLHRAVTHGDLGPVFEGLPEPQLYAPAVRSGRWRWVVFAAAVWLALPFVLMGLVFVVVGREVAAAVFGLLPLVWVIFWWRWASAHRPAGPGSGHDGVAARGGMKWR